MREEQQGPARTYKLKKPILVASSRQVVQVPFQVVGRHIKPDNKGLTRPVTVELLLDSGLHPFYGDCGMLCVELVPLDHWASQHSSHGTRLLVSGSVGGLIAQPHDHAHYHDHYRGRGRCSDPRARSSHLHAGTYVRAPHTAHRACVPLPHAHMGCTLSLS